MMELLFRDDAYLKECAATVVSVNEAGIRLDRTVFYPTGGTHIRSTGEIGAVTVAKIENKGRQNRRVVIRFC